MVRGKQRGDEREAAALCLLRYKEGIVAVMAIVETKKIASVEAREEFSWLTRR